MGETRVMGRESHLLALPGLALLLLSFDIN